MWLYQTKTKNCINFNSCDFIYYTHPKCDRRQVRRWLPSFRPTAQPNWNRRPQRRCTTSRGPCRNRSWIPRERASTGPRGWEVAMGAGAWRRWGTGAPRNTWLPWWTWRRQCWRHSCTRRRAPPRSVSLFNWFVALSWNTFFKYSFYFFCKPDFYDNIYNC